MLSKRKIFYCIKYTGKIIVHPIRAVFIKLYLQSCPSPCAHCSQSPALKGTGGAGRRGGCWRCTVVFPKHEGGGTTPGSSHVLLHLPGLCPCCSCCLEHPPHPPPSPTHKPSQLRLLHMPACVLLPPGRLPSLSASQGCFVIVCSLFWTSRGT